MNPHAEHERLAADAARTAHWKRWGPYLSERQWGTVREDYSASGEAWDYFPHDHARSRAYRWGEDGLLGISDNHQRLCFALALWNGRDPILKERAFGLTGPEGNHGEDVKEYYFYLDATPTHSYLRGLYKYPQAAFPYGQLLAENRRRKADLTLPEYELLDTGVFDENRYFDVTVEYAKAGPEDILIQLTAENRGPAPAPLHLLPTLCCSATPGASAMTKPNPASPGPNCGCSRAGSRTVANVCTPRTQRSARCSCWPKRRRKPCSPRTRPTPPGSSARPTRPRSRRMGSSDTSFMVNPVRSTRQERAPRRRCTTSRRLPPVNPGACGCGCAGASSPRKTRGSWRRSSLFAVETIGVELLDRLPGFGRRFRWFLKHRPGLTGNVSRQCREEEQRGGRLMLSLVSPERLRRILQKLLDETGFLSPYGVRSISRFHREHPYGLRIGDMDYGIDYQPGESTTGLFGGNSNWRGPIWMPMNYLLIESLQKFHRYLGDGFTVECPVNSGRHLNLWEVSLELSRRLGRIFARDPATGRRPVFGGYEKFQTDPHWNAHPLFHEYFHGDDGSGRGASHQTGWTGLIAKILQQTGEHADGNSPG